MPTADDIRADIERVSKKIGDPETESWFQKTYGMGTRDYIASQQRRLSELTGGSRDRDNDNRSRDDTDRYEPRSSPSSRDTSSSPRYSSPDIEDILSQLTGSMKEYLMPYEQMYRDVLSNAPKYEPPSEEELLEQATQWADLQVNPLLQAIDQLLQKARLSIDKQREQIEANYAGFEDTVNRMLAEAGDMATESAIARGGGRSGAVEWLTNKLQTPVMEQATTEQAKKTAALNALAEAIALAEQQAGEKKEQLAERRGALSANRLAELKNFAQAASAADWQRVMDATSNLMGMATQASQFGQSFAANLLPYFVPTVSDSMNYNVSLTEALGEVPEGIGTASSGGITPVPLRSYASERGASIDWDPATKSVIINGKKYSPDQLKKMGGYVQNNAWYIPESAISALI